MPDMTAVKIDAIRRQVSQEVIETIGIKDKAEMSLTDGLLLQALIELRVMQRQLDDIHRGVR